jgi:hypothetical protein
VQIPILIEAENDLFPATLMAGVTMLGSLVWTRAIENFENLVEDLPYIIRTMSLEMERSQKDLVIYLLLQP